jgi:NADPH2:quinone reductase
MFRGIIAIGGPQIRSAAHLRELSADALREAAAGRLRSVIGQTFPLEQAAEAMPPSNTAPPSARRS